jgi:hypothetical protein
MSKPYITETIYDVKSVTWVAIYVMKKSKNNDNGKTCEFMLEYSFNSCLFVVSVCN